MKKHSKIILIFILIFIIAYTNISFSANLNNKTILESNNIVLEDGFKKSTLNYMLKSGESLPSSFNLREELNNNIEVKNQSPNSNCWVYAYTSVLETTMARKNNILNTIYSPMHIDYKTSEIFNRQIGDGGAFNLALAYSVSGYGPVNESDFPKESVYNGNTLKPKNEINLNKEAKARVLGAKVFPSINKTFENSQINYTDAKGNAYTDSSLTTTRNLIKQHLVDNGAVFSAIYIQNTEKCNESTYNGKTVYSYYYNGNNVPDHAVTIVGWDDNFPKENFATNNQPIHNGAYIVLNSWGKNFGDNGYFYVSYDDKFIEEAMSGVTDIQELNNTTKYDKLYEYDELGLTTSISVNNSEKVYLANIFERSSNSSEYISEIGLFINKATGVKVYVNPISDDKTVSEDKLVIEKTGNNALEAGYHTLQFTPVKLTGTKFSVIVEYINGDSNISVPLEMNLVENNFSGQSAEYKTATSTAKSERGQSYIYMGNSWTDLVDLKVNGITIKDTNACIKAFTRFTNNSQGENPGQENPGQEQPQQEQPQSEISVKNISLNMETASIEVGSSTNLIATITPSNATNQKVIWKSENESIAKVVNGIVYGVAEGTTKIVATTEDGNHSGYCTITVIKKTNTADDIYKESPSGNNSKTPTETTQDKTPDTITTKDISSVTEEKSTQSLQVTKLPYTGINKIVVFAIIISVIIAIYTYYKNKKYKNI
ncbi:MAG: Ig-like domain-containing protein [Clostridia bacterium]|nr:Ig-like domain-containing protein [Clostridia bacterium]